MRRVTHRWFAGRAGRVCGIAALAVALGTSALSAQETDPRAAAIDELMTRHEELGLFSGAVLVAEGGEVFYEGAFGLANRELGVPNTVDTRFRIASITKPITTVLVFQLVEDEVLAMDGVISDYLPDYDGEGADVITVEHLITHTSGLVGENSVKDLDDIERHHWTKDELLDHIAGYKLASRPGESARYANFGFFMLAAIMEEATGRTYAELLEEKICKPVGMTDTMADVTMEVIDRRAAGYHYYTDRGIVNAPMIEMSFVYGYGHLLSTVHDLFLFERALRSCELLSLDYTEYLLAVGAATEPLGSSGHEEEVFRWGGSVNGFLCSSHSYIESDRIVVVLSNVKDSRGGTLPSTFDVARNIAAVLFELPYELPK